MALRKITAVVPVIAALALAAAPVAGASAKTAPAAGSPGSTIPCYPYPAFCGPNGTPWFSFSPSQYSPLTNPAFGPGPVQLPGIPVP
jgi:hypothetical protein